MLGEQAQEALDPRRIAEPERDDERDRLRPATEGLGQRPAGLAEREVESRALEGPAAVVTRRRHPGLGGGKEVDRADDPRERIHRVSTVECVDGSGLLEALVVVGTVGDVLADTGLPRSVQRHDRRPPREVARHVALETGEVVRLDLEPEPGEEVESAHRDAITAANATYSATMTPPSARLNPRPVQVRTTAA